MAGTHDARRARVPTLEEELTRSKSSCRVSGPGTRAMALQKMQISVNYNQHLQGGPAPGGEEAVTPGTWSGSSGGGYDAGTADVLMKPLFWCSCCCGAAAVLVHHK